MCVGKIKANSLPDDYQLFEGLRSSLCGISLLKNSNLTTSGYIEGEKHVFTIDTGTSQSLIRPDIVKGKCTPLSNVRLRRATGEPVTGNGKKEVKVGIANISVKHVFIVADIIDEAIIGADFMRSNGNKLDMGQQLMIWRYVQIPLNVGYDNQTQVRKIFAVEKQILRPQSESFIWVRKEGDCADGRLWVVEPTDTKSDLLTAKALVKTCKKGKVPIRVLNLSSNEKVIHQDSGISQCTQAIIISEKESEQASISAKDCEQFAEQMNKWIAELAAPDRKKAKQLLKRYASVFTLKNQRQGRTAIVKYEINTGLERPINQPP